MTEDLVAALNANMGELGTTMGIRITEAGPERVVATMPVEGNRQPYGLLHGGASAVLVETLGSIAAALHGGPGTYPVGIDRDSSLLGDYGGASLPMTVLVGADGRVVASVPGPVDDASLGDLAGLE